MRISVINAWGENRGDEAMHRALIAHVWDVCPNASIGIYSYGSFDLPLKVRQYSISELPLAGLTAFYTHPNLSGLRAILKGIFGVNRKEQNSGKQFFRSSDLVISGPAGPYIGDTYPDLNRACLARIKMAAFFNKPCVIVATSAGGFTKSLRNGVRRTILRGVKWWTLREPLSYEAVKKLALTKTEVELASDIVFSRKLDFDNADVNKTEREELLELGKYTRAPTIGVTITTTDYIEASGKTQSLDRQKYIDSMSRFLKWVVSLTGCQLLFFSHHYGALHEMRLIRAIVSETSLYAKCRIFSPQLNSDCQQLAMRGLVAHISQRYHPCIFAMAAKVPVFCIVHQFKSAGLLDLFKYPVSMPTSMSSCEEWQESFNAFWQRRQEVQQAIIYELPQVRKLASRTVTRLQEELKSL